VPPTSSNIARSFQRSAVSFQLSLFRIPCFMFRLLVSL